MKKKTSDRIAKQNKTQQKSHDETPHPEYIHCRIEWKKKSANNNFDRLIFGLMLV